MAIKQEECEYKAEHPLINRRLIALESWRDTVERDRMSDFKAMTTQLGEVHEKVNSVAIKIEGLRGRGAGWMQAVTTAIAAIALIASIFRK